MVAVVVEVVEVLVAALSDVRRSSVASEVVEVVVVVVFVVVGAGAKAEAKAGAGLTPSSFGVVTDASPLLLFCCCCCRFCRSCE